MSRACMTVCPASAQSIQGLLQHFNFTFACAEGPLGSCPNPATVEIPTGTEVRLRSIDTCESLNSNDGDGSSEDLWTLKGKDYIVRIAPAPEPRLVHAETLPTLASGERFDTFLMATRICTKTRQSGQWVSSHRCFASRLQLQGCYGQAALPISFGRFQEHCSYCVNNKTEAGRIDKLHIDQANSNRQTPV